MFQPIWTAYGVTQILARKTVRTQMLSYDLLVVLVDLLQIFVLLVHVVQYFLVLLCREVIDIAISSLV